MVPRLQLARHQLDDLATIRDLGLAKIGSVADLLGSLDPVAIRPAKLLAAVKGEVGNEDSAESLVRQMVSLYGLTKQIGLTPEQVTAGLRDAIEREAEWSEEQRQQWVKAEPLLVKILNSRSVRLVANAIDLSYEYANLYRRARILTDIRPLFTEAAEAVEGAVVTYTLRLRYDSIDGEHGLSVALDEGDVRDLAAQCERALRKARTAQELLRQKAKVPTVVSGGKDDA